MKLTPLAQGAIRQVDQFKTQVTGGQNTARERAIAKLMEGAGQPQAAERTRPASLAEAPVSANPSASEAPLKSMLQELADGAPSASNPAPNSDVGQRDSIEGSPATEAPPKAATAPANEEPVSTQFAVLARKEKALRAKALAQEQALKAREEALKAKEAELLAKDSEYASKYVPKDRLKTDPFGVLTEEGLTYDQLTELALNAPKPADHATQAYLKKLEAKIAELENSQKTAQKTYQESQQASYKQAIHQIKMEAQELVSSDPAYETIHATNSVDDVVQLIERVYKEKGIVLPVEKAAQVVEEELLEEALKLHKIKKIQERLKAATPATPVAAPAQQQPQVKTLTNSMTSTKPMSARDRAIAAMQGRLGK